MSVSSDAIVPVDGVSAAALAWRYRGELRVTAVVKATFGFASDGVMARGEPRAVDAGDLVPYLKRADVLFTGHDAGRPDGQGLARFAIFDGARALVDKALPATDLGLAARGRATFGPGLAEIPDSFDWDSLQTAPADQQVAYLRGDEWIVLEGLDPEEPRLRMRLPGARAQARLHGLAGHGLAEGKALALHADTLHVIGGERCCTLTWRGSFAIRAEAAFEAMRIAVGVELPGAPIAWPERAELLRRASSSPSPVLEHAAADATLELSDSDIQPVSDESPEPRTAGGKSPVAAFLASLSGHEHGKSPKAGAKVSADHTLPVPSSAPATRALPFIKAASGANLPVSVGAAAKIAAIQARGDAGATLPLPEGGEARPVLPFQVEAPAAEKVAVAPEVAAAPEPQALPLPKQAVWAPPPEAPPPPPPREKKAPPKVNVLQKLYGRDKK